MTLGWKLILLLLGSCCHSVSLAQENAEPGQNCLGPGWHSVNGVCIACGIGYMCPEGTSTAVQCEVGTYQDMQRRASCRYTVVYTPSERFSENVALTSLCRECGVGTYQSLIGQASCVPCA